MTTTWKLAGNTDVLGDLARTAEAGKPNHAYLFTGPAHLGKGAAARKFARALICGRSQAPCGTCPNCELAEAGNHPDYFELSDERFGISEARSITAALSLKPHSAPFRVAVITDAERLTVQAQSAMLKLLEEPPGSAVLILTATSPGQLLPTTVSRCRQIRFTVPAAPEVAKHFGGSTDAKAAIEAADRRPGLAATLLADPEELGRRQEWEQAFERAVTAEIPDRLALAKELSGDDRLPDIFDSWISLLRASIGSRPVSNTGAARLRDAYSERDLGEMLGRVFAARRRLRYNPNVQLLVEHLLLRLTD